LSITNNSIQAEVYDAVVSEQNDAVIANLEEFEIETDTPVFAMIGYATLSGEGLVTTTGGAGGAVDTITTLEQLLQMADDREKSTIPAIWYIKGKIESPETQTATIKHGANITILGYGADAELKNIGLRFWDYNNVIVRNLKIHEVLYPNDAITIDECHHVWIDHNELHSIIGEGIGVDTYDGLLDIKRGSRYVTVSWNYLHDHMKCSLIGHTDNLNQEATDSLFRISFHHNWFSNTDGRNPSLRFGAVHMFNNYCENISDYGIAVRQGAHALLENNHYESVKTPITTNKFKGPEGWVCESGNIYSGSCSVNDNSITQTDCEFWNATELPYSYILDPASDVATLVQQFAGVGILDTNQYTVIDTLPGTDPPVQDNSLTLHGINIIGPYPNPSSGIFSIRIRTPKALVVDMSISDLSGRVMDRIQNVTNPEGELIFTYNNRNLPAGIYLCIIHTSENRIVRRLVVR
jgi:pectate lyase